MCIRIYKLDDVDISRNLIGSQSVANEQCPCTPREVDNFRRKTMVGVTPVLR